MLACPRPFRLSCSKSGFSLIESVIVLGIVALVLAGIWAAMSRVRENYNITRTAEGVIQIINGNRKLWYNRDISALSFFTWADQTTVTNAAIGAGIVPKDWVDSRCSLGVCNSFGMFVGIRLGATGVSAYPYATGMQIIVPSRAAANAIVNAVLVNNRIVYNVQCYQWIGSASVNAWQSSLNSPQPGPAKCPPPDNGRIYIDITLPL